MNKRLSILFLLVLVTFELYGCENNGLISDNVDLSSYSAEEARGLYNMIRKAEYISSFEWTPVADISSGRAYYPANMTVRGIPYSSVKEIDTYVGLQVSFYTFYTAVTNPRSVLYTEDITKSPYHGINCSTYYGTVCSTTVEYALGIDLPYGTARYDTLSCFQRRTYSVPDSVQIGDVLLSNGHVVLVVNVKRGASNESQQVQILESSSVGTTASIRRYNLTSFAKRWYDMKWVPYSYNGIEGNDLGIDGCNTYCVNKSICPNKGDKSCYRTTDTVMVNALSENIARVIVFKDGVEYKQMELSENSRDAMLYDLPYGCYRAIAIDANGIEVDVCHFNVIETNVNVEHLGNNQIKVTFGSRNSTPYYIRVNYINGKGARLVMIDESDRSAGNKIVSIPSNPDIYCKVLFKDEFGQISNVPIKIQ